MNKSDTSGFTLIELLVVISIIGLLSSVVLASLNAARDKARVAKVRADADQIYKAFYAAVTDTGQLYLNKTETSGQVGSGSQQAIWHTPDCNGPQNADAEDRPNGEYVRQFATAISKYMGSIPLDPWGAPYWIDSAYLCTAGEPSNCVAGGWYYAIGSGGPNNSVPNTYDSDNVVLAICRHQ